MGYLWDLIGDVVKRGIVTGVGSAIGAGLGVVVAYLLYKLWHEKRYGHWAAVLMDGDRQIDRQDLGVETTKRWIYDAWERKLGLKSLCADNQCMLNTNVLNISEIDPQKRAFVVRFDRNPPAPSKPA